MTTIERLNAPFDPDRVLPLLKEHRDSGFWIRRLRS